jgi:cyclophilin family peptidyl-prolyl cis-trans isomerase
VPSAKRERKRAGRAARQEAIRAAQRRQARQRQVVLFAGIVAVVFVLGFFLFRGKGGSNDDSTVNASKTATTAKASGSIPGCAVKSMSFKQADQVVDPAKTYSAKIETDAGTFTVEFDTKRTPKTANNFVFLAQKGFYNCVTFHRVIPDFVIQGGDPTGSGSGGPGYQFEDEALDGTTYAAGDIAMANSGPNTNGSQFFVITSDNGAQTLLSAAGGVPKYTRFGKVTSGMDVVKKIEGDGGTNQGNGTDIKVKHYIKKISIEEH